MNKFIISGRLGKQPSLNNTGNFNKVHLSIGSEKTVKSANGGYEKGVAWNTVTVFGKVAENCANYLQKGQYVTVEGTVETVQKDDSYFTYLTASSVEFGPKAASKSNNQNVDVTIPF